MKDCSICKYCDEDFDFDEETGEEYPVFECQKGNDTSLDYECKDFEKYKPHKIGGRNGESIDCSTLEDEPVIVADNEADRQALRDCFKG